MSLPDLKTINLLIHRSSVLSRVKWSVIVLSGLSGIFVAIGLIRARASFAHDWWLQIAVFVAVAVLPHWMVDKVSTWAEVTLPDPFHKDIKHGFQNTGSFVGLVERPLYLAALISGQQAFVGVWFVLKGVAGYKIGRDRDNRGAERPRFQLFLLNNALSLAGAALGWLAWKFLLRLPTWS